MHNFNKTYVTKHIDWKNCIHISCRKKAGKIMVVKIRPLFLWSSDKIIMMSVENFGRVIFTTGANDKYSVIIIIGK